MGRRAGGGERPRRVLQRHGRVDAQLRRERAEAPLELLRRRRRVVRKDKVQGVRAERGGAHPQRQLEALARLQLAIGQRQRHERIVGWPVGDWDVRAGRRRLLARLLRRRRILGGEPRALRADDAAAARRRRPGRACPGRRRRPSRRTRGPRGGRGRRTRDARGGASRRAAASARRC